MATCRDIISRALHMARIVDREDDPTAAELRDGITVLNSLYEGWLMSGMFRRLSDVYSAGDYEAGEAQRIFIESGTATLPETIDNDRKPRDLTALEITDDNGRRAYVWDRTAWAQITGLSENDEAPLATRSFNGLAACVAAAFAEEFGAEITGSIARQSAAFKMALSLKLGSEQDLVSGTYF